MVQQKELPASLLRPDQAAHLLSISMRTLENWRHKGLGPEFVRISSRCIRYRLSDLENWQQAISAKNTAT
jgi:predicted DNA-binding transcriptional regulator AlpA